MMNIMQQHKQTTRPRGGGIGKFCSPLEVMVMVAMLLLVFLQLSCRRQGGELQ
jgi:hypothetical protein